MFKRIVGRFAGKWPGQARQRHPLQVILHGAARNAEHHRDLAAACSTSGKPERLS
ncbi:hypothetical protein ACVINY_004001 [Sinorhizobium meliloti]